LIEGRGLEASGYGIIRKMPTVIDMPMSRASGIARFAAVPGIVSFVLFLRQKGVTRLLWGGVTVFCAALIYWMQSRGAVLGFVVAIAFVPLCGSQKARHLAVYLLVLLGLAAILNVIPEEVMGHLTRRESVQRMGLLTGRERAWHNAFGMILQSPIWGWGYQSDRLLIREHVHNTFLYTLLTGGFIGGAAFTVGLLLAWRNFFRVLGNDAALRLGQQTVLIQVGSLLAFFTVRGMSEVCGGMFGVDYMVMLAAIAYLGVLDRTVRAGTAPPAGARAGPGAAERRMG
jgi:O-antigen ligase